MQWMSWRNGIATGVAAVLLAACGGGFDGYGAIAVSRSSNRVVITSSHLTQSSANEAARDECDASDCTVVLQFEECGAAAAANNSSGALIIGVGAGASAFDAQTAANTMCSVNGGVGCGAIPNMPAECN